MWIKEGEPIGDFQIWVWKDDNSLLGSDYNAAIQDLMWPEMAGFYFDPEWHNHPRYRDGTLGECVSRCVKEMMGV